jgi:hypothetical protein
VGVAIGLVLVAAGAILTWAVNADVSGLDITAVGVILLIVGIVVVLLDFFWWRSWEWAAAGGPRRRTYVRDAYGPTPAAPAVRPRRRVVDVQEEVDDPAGPPP